MKKSYLLLLLPLAAATTGCHDHDYAGEGADILLTASVYSPTSQGDQALINGTTVYVTAFSMDKDSVIHTVMRDAALTKGNDSRWSYYPIAQWPADPVSFYAYSPAIDNDVQITPKAQWADFACDGRHDFIYAVAPDMYRPGGTVNLNFRHALARVTFLWSVAPKATYNITVEGVTLHGILNRSTFTFPRLSTGIGSITAPGQWSPTMAKPDELASVSYTIAQTQPQPELLTSEGADLCTTMAYFFIPQTLNAYMAEGNGAYVEACVQITDPATGDVIWPQTGGYGPVRIGVKTADVPRWDATKAYTYDIMVSFDGHAPWATCTVSSIEY